MYENIYKGLHKSAENHWNFLNFVIKVNFNFSLRRNTIFSRINIIFFNETGDVIFKCFFWGEDHLFIFDRGIVLYL